MSERENEIAVVAATLFGLAIVEEGNVGEQTKIIEEYRRKGIEARMANEREYVRIEGKPKGYDFVVAPAMELIAGKGWKKLALEEQFAKLKSFSEKVEKKFDEANLKLHKMKNAGEDPQALLKAQAEYKMAGMNLGSCLIMTDYYKIKKAEKERKPREFTYERSL